MSEINANIIVGTITQEIVVSEFPINVTPENFNTNFYLGGYATAAGNVTEVQYNGGGILQGAPGLIYDAANSETEITNLIVSTSANLGNLATANYITATFTSSSSSQPNITTVGNLTSLTVTGNTTLGNLVSGNYFIGNLYGTANIAVIAGTVTTNAQPNITSVGNLTSLTVTGNTTLGNSVSANFFVGNFSGNATTAGTVTVNAQPNITSVGNLSNLTVTNTLTVGNKINLQSNKVTLGSGAGNVNQANNVVAIGFQAGGTNQGALATAVGPGAGANNQGGEAVAIGTGAGANNQGVAAIAIGENAGTNAQTLGAIAIGYDAGVTTQGLVSIAIGHSAGRNNQSANAIAIGYNAGKNNQHANTIIISATGIDLNSSQSNTLYIKPIRNSANTNVLMYDATTGEITYELLQNYTGYVKTNSTTVASLITAGTAGAGSRSFVTDANTNTFNNIVGGGGSNAVPIFSDGTNWRVG